MKLKEVIIYSIVVAVNILLGFLLKTLIFEGNNSYFIFVICGIILLSLLIDSIIATKLGYKLDIFAYNITDQKYLLLNSIFIGELFSIPISMFISMVL
jgi:hypothetical protein